MNGEGIEAGSAREDVAVQGSNRSPMGTERVWLGDAIGWGRSPMGTERVRGEDTLTVIERWMLVWTEGKGDPNDGRQAYVIGPHLPAGSDAVAVVPEAQLAGAVEALRTIAAAPKNVYPGEFPEPMSRHEMVRVAQRALAALGGQ